MQMYHAMFNHLFYHLFHTLYYIQLKVHFILCDYIPTYLQKENYLIKCFFSSQILMMFFIFPGLYWIIQKGVGEI